MGERRQIAALIGLSGTLTVIVFLLAIFTGNLKLSRDPLPTISSAPEFTLINTNNTAYGSKNLAGKVYIVDFFFSRCQGPCPVLAQKMGALVRSFDGQPTVQFVSISVDPDYDTPTVLAQYAQSLNADQTRWHFLTGEKATITQLVTTGFKVGGQPIMAHSVYMVVVDKMGMIRGYYDAMDEKSYRKLFVDISKLVSEKQP